MRKSTQKSFFPRKPSYVFFLVMVCFLTYYILFKNFKTIKSLLDDLTHQGLVSYILTYLLIGIPIFIGTILINNKRNILESLGISKNYLTGLLAGILFTLPMFIGGMLFYKFNHQIELENLIAGTIVAGFMEELYFRGFLFGQLFRNSQIGFIPAVFFGALIFASGHLYQSQDLREMTGIFVITFFGAIFFAWLFAEWNYNLWIPVFTHSLMNLSWELFRIDDTALGGIAANISRGLTIAFAIGFTIIYKRRKHQEFEINKLTLLLKK